MLFPKLIKKFVIFFGFFFSRCTYTLFKAESHWSGIFLKKYVTKMRLNEQKILLKKLN